MSTIRELRDYLSRIIDLDPRYGDGINVKFVKYCPTEDGKFTQTKTIDIILPNDSNNWMSPHVNLVGKELWLDKD